MDEHDAERHDCAALRCPLEAARTNVRRLLRRPIAKEAKRQRERSAVGRIAELAARPSGDKCEHPSAEAWPEGDAPVAAKDRRPAFVHLRVVASCLRHCHFGAMVSANLRRLLVGVTAISANLGWLQLAPAFGYPVTAPAGMLDRIFGATREAGLVGWALLLLGQAVIAALMFLVVERQTRVALTSLAFAVGAWFISGAVLMPLIGLVQSAPAPGALPSDPMRANFFMLNLGLGAAAEALVGWLLFGAVIAAGSMLQVSLRAFTFAVGAAVIAAALTLAVPALGAQAGSGRAVEGRIDVPPTPVFISVLELPQP